MKVSILGEGVWGKAVGKLLLAQQHEVKFVHHQEKKWAQTNPDFVFIALPVQSIRETLAHFPVPHVPILNLSKGMEISTGYRVSEIVKEMWKEERVATLSGPNFASEISQGLPATCVIASPDEKLAQQFQSLLHQPTFRTYSSTDLIGVEIGGALKNIYAVAGGICLGLQLGENSFAGLITRCLAEMTRIGVQLGSRAETFSGLSGVGDLLLTATSEQSRNHRVGKLLAEGKALEEILTLVGGVAEGVPTTKSVYLNATIPLDSKPIVTEIYRILYEQKPLAQAIRDLLERTQKSE